MNTREVANDQEISDTTSPHLDSRLLVLQAAEKLALSQPSQFSISYAGGKDSKHLTASTYITPEGSTPMELQLGLTREGDNFTGTVNLRGQHGRPIYRLDAQLGPPAEEEYQSWVKKEKDLKAKLGPKANLQVFLEKFTHYGDQPVYLDDFWAETEISTEEARQILQQPSTLTPHSALRPTLKQFLQARNQWQAESQPGQEQPSIFSRLLTPAE